MKRTLSLLSFFCVLIVIGCFAMLQVGCEEAKGLDGLTLDPASAVLSTNGQSTVFTVTGGITNRDLSLPLKWSVSDSSLGSVTFSSGYSATYRRSTVDGVNTLIVRDQYDNEGYATIQQTAATYSLELTASATSIDVGGASTITITSTDSMAPYSWRKRSGPGSVTGESGSISAVFTSSTAGTAVIEVTDANGASGIIGIVVNSPVLTGESNGNSGT